MLEAGPSERMRPMKHFLMGGIGESNLEYLSFEGAEFFRQEDLDQLIDILVLSHLPLKELVISMGWHEVSLNHKQGIRDSELKKRPYTLHVTHF